MQEEWRNVVDFPEYLVSNYGEVRSLRTERLLKPHVNQRNVSYVVLVLDHVQKNRSISKLVADAFLEPPIRPVFNTPINRNGDRTDNVVTNLLWRPRSFAIMYVRQFNYPLRHGFRQPVVEYDTEEVYPNTFEAAITFGLLDIDVAKAALNQAGYKKYVFPTDQRFDLYETDIYEEGLFYEG